MTTITKEGLLGTMAYVSPSAAQECLKTEGALERLILYKCDLGKPSYATTQPQINGCLRQGFACARHPWVDAPHSILLPVVLHLNSSALVAQLSSHEMHRVRKSKLIGR